MYRNYGHMGVMSWWYHRPWLKLPCYLAGVIGYAFAVEHLRKRKEKAVRDEEKPSEELMSERRVKRRRLLVMIICGVAFWLLLMFLLMHFSPAGRG